MMGYMIKCPVCDSEDIRYDSRRGEYYCGSCGYVIDDMEQVVGRQYYTLQRYGSMTEQEYRNYIELNRKIRRTKSYGEVKPRYEDLLEAVLKRYNVSYVDISRAKRLMYKIIEEEHIQKSRTLVAAIVARYILLERGLILPLEVVAEQFDVAEDKFRRLRSLWRRMYAKGYFKKRVTVMDYLNYGLGELDIPYDFMDDIYEIWAVIDGETGGYSANMSPRIFAALLVYILNKKYDFGIKLSEIAEKFEVSPLVIRMHMKNVENIVRKCLEVEKDAKGVGCKEVREDN